MSRRAGPGGVTRDRLTRRRLLRAGAAAGLCPGVVGASASARHADWTATVATWNLGLGAELGSLALPGPAPVSDRVGRLYRRVTDTHPGARMDAIAASLAEANPDAVGVQEAAVVRRNPGTDDETVVVDLLGDLLAALNDRGAPYRRAAVVTNVDWEFPARIDDETVDVRLTDRDALLVRADRDVGVEAATTGTYDASVSVSIGGQRRVEMRRGYAAADLRIRERSLTAVTARLEPALADVGTAQAAELATVVASRSSPAVVLGDLARGPGDRDRESARESDAWSSDAGVPDAYDRLTATLTDPIDPETWATEYGTGTCCRPGSLRPPDPDGLSRRPDHVLVDGLQAAGSRRLGMEPASVDGGTVWPSDHAGVLAELTPDPAASTAAETSTPEGETPSATTATGVPGFGWPTAVAAACVAAWAALRR